MCFWYCFISLFSPLVFLLLPLPCPTFSSSSSPFPPPSPLSLFNYTYLDIYTMFHVTLLYSMCCSLGTSYWLVFQFTNLSLAVLIYYTVISIYWVLNFRIRIFIWFTLIDFSSLLKFSIWSHNFLYILIAYVLKSMSYNINIWIFREPISIVCFFSWFSAIWSCLLRCPGKF